MATDSRIRAGEAAVGVCAGDSTKDVESTDVDSIDVESMCCSLLSKQHLYF